MLATSAVRDDDSAKDALAKFGKLDKNVIEYCASEEALVVYYVLLAMSWSALSMGHHVIRSLPLFV